MIDVQTLIQIVLATIAPFILIGGACLVAYEMGKRSGKRE